MTLTNLDLLRLKMTIHLPSKFSETFQEALETRPWRKATQGTANPPILLLLLSVAANPFETFPRSSLGGRCATLWFGPLILMTTEWLQSVCLPPNKQSLAGLFVHVHGLQVNGRFLPYQPLKATWTTSLAGIIMLDCDHLVLSKEDSQLSLWKYVALGEKNKRKLGNSFVCFQLYHGWFSAGN